MQNNKISSKCSFFFLVLGIPVGQPGARPQELGAEENEAPPSLWGWFSDGALAQYSEGQGSVPSSTEKQALPFSPRFAESVYVLVNQ